MGCSDGKIRLYGKDSIPFLFINPCSGHSLKQQVKRLTNGIGLVNLPSLAGHSLQNYIADEYLVVNFENNSATIYSQSNNTIKFTFILKSQNQEDNK